MGCAESSIKLYYCGLCKSLAIKNIIKALIKRAILTGVCIWALTAITVAQDWRLSAGYNLSYPGLNYVPGSNYSGQITPTGKGLIEVEVERYLLYRLYLAGKLDYLSHNEESVFLGGPVNFNQINAGALGGLQWEKWGFYAGIKAGHMWGIRIQGLDANDNTVWLRSSTPEQLTAAYFGGIKYYLMSFLRLQVEVSQNITPAVEFSPEHQFGISPALHSFEFNPYTISVGLAVSIPWHSRKRLHRINDRGSLPILGAGSVSFSSPMRKPAVITSAYGPRWNSNHKGVDIDADRGDDIVAAADGVVVKAGVGSGYGKMVEIRHSDGFSTIYAHMRRLTVRAGQKIRRGQVIGKAGNTGTATGVHLHFEILKNGVHVDPQSFIRF